MTDCCEIMLMRAESAEGDDPLLGRFSDFLARDIASYPERLQAVKIGLAQRLNESPRVF